MCFTAKSHFGQEFVNCVMRAISFPQDISVFNPMELCVLYKIVKCVCLTINVLSAS